MTTDQPDKKGILAQIKDHISEFVKERVEEVRTAFYKEGARLIGPLLVWVVLVLVLLLLILFSSVFVATYLNSFFHSAWYGYGMVTIFYGLLFFLLFIFRKSLVNRFFTRSLFDQWIQKNPEDID